MMPPETVKPIPAGSRVVPYPNEALNLGGGRWLERTGQITTERPMLEGELNSQTLEYWEAAALRGQGVPLSELIV